VYVIGGYQLQSTTYGSQYEDFWPRPVLTMYSYNIEEDKWSREKDVDLGVNRRLKRVKLQGIMKGHAAVVDDKIYYCGGITMGGKQPSPGSGKKGYSEVYKNSDFMFKYDFKEEKWEIEMDDQQIEEGTKITSFKEFYSLRQSFICEKVMWIVSATVKLKTLCPPDPRQDSSDPFHDGLRQKKVQLKSFEKQMGLKLRMMKPSNESDGGFSRRITMVHPGEYEDQSSLDDNSSNSMDEESSDEQD